MIIHMLQYNKQAGVYMPAGKIDSSEWPLHDAFANFIKDNNVDISIYLRSTLLTEVQKNLSEFETNMNIDEFIDNYKHPLSQASFCDFGYAVQKDADMLFMPGDPFEMGISDANILLKFVFGNFTDKFGKEKPHYVLTYLDRVQ